LIFGYNDFFDKYKYHEEKIIIGEKRKTIIYFLPDSAKLTENANVILSDIPIYDEQIVIEGNVNGFPNCEDSFGMLLAQERAENVKTYLVEKGLSSKKITIINNGCKKPVNKDDTEKELRKNRRVEIYYVNI
jgi:outer membrane protein OmpA-like peptidoglycan-associated protein